LQEGRIAADSAMHGYKARSRHKREEKVFINNYIMPACGDIEILWKTCTIRI